MSSIRFNLEQQILNCWHLTSDLEDLFEEIVEGDMTKDQISNVVLGAYELYNIKFNKAFRTFEQASRHIWELEQRVKELEGQVEQHERREKNLEWLEAQKKAATKPKRKRAPKKEKPQ